MNLEGTTERLALQTEVLINLTDVKQAAVSEDNQQAGYRVNLVFTSEGAERFRNITRDNLRKRAGVIVDGVLVYAP
jgi:preprotein translocase subunit SecD